MDASLEAAAQQRLTRIEKLVDGLTSYKSGPHAIKLTKEVIASLDFVFREPCPSLQTLSAKRLNLLLYSLWQGNRRLLYQLIESGKISLGQRTSEGFLVGDFLQSFSGNRWNSVGDRAVRKSPYYKYDARIYYDEISDALNILLAGVQVSGMIEMASIAFLYQRLEDAAIAAPDYVLKNARKAIIECLFRAQMGPAFFGVFSLILPNLNFSVDLTREQKLALFRYIKNNRPGELASICRHGYLRVDDEVAPIMLEAGFNKDAVLMAAQLTKENVAICDLALSGFTCQERWFAQVLRHVHRQQNAQALLDAEMEILVRLLRQGGQYAHDEAMAVVEALERHPRYSQDFALLTPIAEECGSLEVFKVNLRRVLQKNPVLAREVSGLIAAMRTISPTINECGSSNETVMQRLCSFIDVDQLFNQDYAENLYQITRLAMALLDRGASLNLNVRQKSDLVKALAVAEPHYLCQMVERGDLDPTFKLDGVELIDRFIARIPPAIAPKTRTRRFEALMAEARINFDPVARKKAKMLESPLALQDPQILATDDPRRERALRHMRDGESLKRGNVQFCDVALSRRRGLYVVTAQNPVVTKFGVDMFRIAGCKSKDVKIAIFDLPDQPRQMRCVIKWDQALRDSYYCRDRENPSFNHKANCDYARMAGAMVVFAEWDWNGANFRDSAKSSSIVKIDPGMFFSDESHYQALRGSFFGLEILRKRFAGGDLGQSSWLYRLAMDLDTEKERAEALTEIFNTGIDDDLLESIKENIAHNVELQEEFLAFMDGLQAAIDLACDEEFLQTYMQKYRDELGAEAHAIASECERVFAHNAVQAASQFAKYFEYAQDLRLASRHRMAEDRLVPAQLVRVRADDWGIQIEQRDAPSVPRDRDFVPRTKLDKRPAAARKLAPPSRLSVLEPA